MRKFMIMAVLTILAAGSALAAVLSDLVGTRHRMLDELSVR